MCCYLYVEAGDETLRRVISPSQPAWIIHIDVWNYADPQKIIDMVPEDVRPFVIFNIATSSSDEKSADGPTIYDSWMKVCAQNRVWTMIQCASGAANRMPDTPDDLSAYEQYFKDYPNFLGFNFAEQFWGFGEDGRVDFPTRLQMFANLMPICHKYGGYLAVSFTDSYYSSSKMPIAYLKRNAQMREFLQNDAEHFLCFEKYTLKKNFLDIESGCLGQWIGGYAGQYGIRFDSSGWLAESDVTDQTKGAAPFVRAAGAMPIVEHMMLTGQTMVDGPELVWTECSRETANTTVDGYTHRNWGWLPQFENVSLDLFRKILDGTIRIPTKEEVMGRTKVCLVNDINNNLTSEGEHNSYITPENFFDGLYRSDIDKGGASNGWLTNRWWLKRTGRYPSIPMTYGEVSGLQTFRKSEFDKTAFDAWMNSTFPEEYSGDIYAGRHENGWVTYNPYQYDESTEGGYRICSASIKRAEGMIPLQYNTCESIALSYAPYSMGIIKEYSNKIDMYLTNYQTDGTVSEDVISISGASAEPVVTWKDRGSHVASTVTTDWTEGRLTVTVKHNGPLDITIRCTGKATEKKTAYTTASITVPEAPPAYEGKLQYEAELADYQKATISKTGYGQGRDGYRGQGYATLTAGSGKLRFACSAPEGTSYLMTIYYQTDADGSMKIGEETTLTAHKADEWQTASLLVHLDEGSNMVTLHNTGGSSLYIDCITLERVEAHAFTPDERGEYHVLLASLIPAGSVTYNPTTGEVTQVTTNGQTGSLSFLLDSADFTDVQSLTVSYDGNGDIFRYLTISDNTGASVNPDGNRGAFWSSKYNLNYTDYQLSDASRNVCKLEWTAAAPQARTMTINDILIKVMSATATGNVKADSWQEETVSPTHYNLMGQQIRTAGRGIHIVKTGRGVIKVVKG